MALKPHHQKASQDSCELSVGSPRRIVPWVCVFAPPRRQLVTRSPSPLDLTLYESELETGFHLDDEPPGVIPPNI
ncbi:hypothetical protein EYF80_025658 [Liparis tanakae]|uniref:Uncharacterized protein n=1 Tax=Liparis tanakae TaxID=230148 RepID=A0A4Z2HF31_9TELE|nr:hypothetical protein EYF80_025658 [Liparis tanakae]